MTTTTSTTTRFQHGSPPLPEWLEDIRPNQAAAVEGVVDAFRDGARAVLMEGPTGCGKSLVGELVRRALGTRALYVCTTKSLQNQMVRDFPYARVLKGRGNYATFDYPERFHARRDWDRLTCADCTKQKLGEGAWSACHWCQNMHQCPYEQAKAAALRSRLAVINTSYFLHEANGVVSNFSNWPLVIADEADMLEAELLNHVSVVIGPRLRKDLGIRPPERKTVEEAWTEWVRDEAIPKVKTALEALPRSSASLPVIRRVQSLTRLLADLNLLARELPEGGWVYMGDSARQEDKQAALGLDAPHSIVFKPIRVDKFGKSLLFNHAPRWLLMSATIIEPMEPIESLGIGDDWAFVVMPSSFDPSIRPIRPVMVADMTNKLKETSWPKMAEGIRKVLRRHPDERVLIHTVSYSLAAFLHERLKDTGRVMTYKTALDRDVVLAKYREVPGSVLIAPSFERGIDLKGDDCRVVIVAKIPYPNLGDKQVSARLYSKGGQLWFTVQAIRTLVQMTGRGVRSPDDYAVNYILDQQFMVLWRKHRRLLPRWWQDAIRWDTRL